MRCIAGALCVMAGCIESMAEPSLATGRDPPQEELDSELQRAMQMYRSGEYEAAFSAFAELLKQRPGDPEVNFGLGMAALAVGKLSHAAVGFERVLALQSGNDRARLELARTYAAMGQFELSEHYFREVLDRAPPEAVRRSVHRYLTEIGKAKRRWHVVTGIGVGILYDDNVNVGPAGAIVDIAPTQVGLAVFDELEVAEGSRPREDAGGFSSFSLNGLYDPGIRGRWMLQSGAAFYQTRLLEEQEFEVTYLRGYVGMRHSGPRHLLDGRMYADALRRGGDGFVRIYGVTPAWIRASSERLRWTTYGAVELRDYREADDLDAAYAELGQRGAWSRAEEGGALSGGLAAIYNDADSHAFTYAGLSAEIVLRARLPLAWEGYTRGGYRYSRYDEAEALAEGPRRDHEWNAEVRLERPINRRAVIQARYQHTRNDSSFDLYTYRRNVVTLSVDVSF